MFVFALGYFNFRNIMQVQYFSGDIMDTHFVEVVLPRDDRTHAMQAIEMGHIKHVAKRILVIWNF